MLGGFVRIDSDFPRKIYSGLIGQGFGPAEPCPRKSMLPRDNRGHGWVYWPQNVQMLLCTLLIPLMMRRTQRKIYSGLIGPGFGPAEPWSQGELVTLRSWRQTNLSIFTSESTDATSHSHDAVIDEPDSKENMQWVNSTGIWTCRTLVSGKACYPEIIKPDEFEYIYLRKHRCYYALSWCCYWWAGF